MGLFDSIRNAIGGTAAGNPDHSGLLDEAIGLLGQPQSGGLTSLLNKFKNAGLQHLVDGWVSTGPNPPATADHIQAALGSAQIQQIAARLGIPPQQAASGLAAILPRLIDHLTPNGTVPDSSAASS